jgi:LCP family protein required for cell wall assembly
MTVNSVGEMLMRSKKYNDLVEQERKSSGYQKAEEKGTAAEAQSRGAEQKTHKPAAEGSKKAAAGTGGPGKPTKKKWPRRLLITLIVIALLAGGGYAAARHYINSKLNKVKHTTVKKSELSCVDVKGYVNIALLGVDSRKMNKSNLSDNNTDCIMIISLNTKTNEVSLLSVYRDTYLPVDDDGNFGKINSAFQNGGAAQTMQSLNESMDLDISNYVLFNFKMVANLVDEVGGITVDVKSYEIQQLNKYTIQTANNIGQKKYKLVTKPGKQKLEGVQAVSYGRIRKGVGDDYKRTSRMRVVVEKVMQKVKGSSVTRLNKIMDVCLKQCETSLSNEDMLSLAMKLSKMKIKQSVGWPFEVTEGYADQQAVVFPDNLEENVIELHKKLFGQKNYTPTSTVKEIAEKLGSIISTGSTSGSSGSSSNAKASNNGGNHSSSAASSGNSGNAGTSRSGNSTASGNSSNGSPSSTAGETTGNSAASAGGTASSGSTGEAEGGSGTEAGQNGNQ